MLGAAPDSLSYSWWEPNQLVVRCDGQKKLWFGPDYRNEEAADVVGKEFSLWGVAEKNA